MVGERNDISNQGEVPVRAGVTAGSIAAIIGSLANLPLQAPTDTLFNAATVTVTSLFMGALCGWLWARFSSNSRGPILFAGSLLFAFAVVAVTAFGLDTKIDGLILYVIPLATIIFGVVFGLTPLLSRASTTVPAWLSVIVFALAIFIGTGLANCGDASAGTLTLPPRSMIINTFEQGAG